MMKLGALAATGYLIVWGFMQPVMAACNPNMSRFRPDSRYEVVQGTGGVEVRDKVTSLVWKRCSLGMTWNGTTCTGAATQRTWQQALDAARTATPSAVVGASPWRLPNATELHSLVERACYTPAINTTWFPATPSNITWTSSPNKDASSSTWALDFNDGSNDGYSKTSAYFVRLVRSDP